MVVKTHKHKHARKQSRRSMKGGMLSEQDKARIAEHKQRITLELADMIARVNKLDPYDSYNQELPDLLKQIDEIKHHLSSPGSSYWNPGSNNPMSNMSHEQQQAYL